MKYLNSRHMFSVLEPLCTGRSLFVFDFDGTLAPIVARRTRAVMPHTTRELFERLAALSTTAVISGRSVSDLQALMRVHPVYLVGNHGMEGLPGTGTLLRRAQRLCISWRQQLESSWCASPCAGIDVEDKTYTLAIHYRLAPDARRARKVIAQALATLSPAPQLLAGKKVINVLPPGAPDKGAALLHLMRRTRSTRALFIGDDDTDEAVFALEDRRIITVRVGRKHRSLAQYFLRRQTEVNGVLRHLIHGFDLGADRDNRASNER